MKAVRVQVGGHRQLVLEGDREHIPRSDDQRRAGHATVEGEGSHRGATADSAATSVTSKTPPALRSTSGSPSWSPGAAGVPVPGVVGVVVGELWFVCIQTRPAPPATTTAAPIPPNVSAVRRLIGSIRDPPRIHCIAPHHTSPSTVSTAACSAQYGRSPLRAVGQRSRRVCTPRGYH